MMDVLMLEEVLDQVRVEGEMVEKMAVVMVDNSAVD